MGVQRAAGGDGNVVRSLNISWRNLGLEQTSFQMWYMLSSFAGSDTDGIPNQLEIGRLPGSSQPLKTSRSQLVYAPADGHEEL